MPNQMNMVSNRIKVFKTRSYWARLINPGVVIEKPWIVAGLPYGTQSFETWQEAMAIATGYRSVLMN